MMIEFVLIVHIWTGMLSKYESQSSVVIHGFQKEAECRTAGEQAKHKFSTGVRSADYVCIVRGAK